MENLQIEAMAGLNAKVGPRMSLIVYLLQGQSQFWIIYFPEVDEDRPIVWILCNMFQYSQLSFGKWLWLLDVEEVESGIREKFMR